MSEQRITIRQGRCADAAGLTRLARRSKAHWGYPAHWLRLWEEELAITEGAIEGAVVRVAEEAGGAAVGFALAEPAGTWWALAHLWVHPDFMGLGVGRALVGEMLKEAAASGAAGLEITSDPHAERFYLRLGARRVGAVPSPAPGAPDRVLPVLRLDARSDA